MLLGAGVGALGSAAFKYFGESDNPWSPQFNYQLPKNRPLITGNEKTPPWETWEKSGSIQEISVSKIRSVLKNDHGLTPADKRVLLDQLRRAELSMGSSLDIDRLRGGAFGALLGYILAKILNFGNVGTAAATVVGGLLGSQGRRGAKRDPRGFYYY